MDGWIAYASGAAADASLAQAQKEVNTRRAATYAEGAIAAGKVRFQLCNAHVSVAFAQLMSSFAYLLFARTRGMKSSRTLSHARPPARRKKATNSAFNVTVRMAEGDLLDSEGPSACSGGVVLAGAGGRIVCDNTLDARLELAFEGLLPVINHTLFPKA